MMHMCGCLAEMQQTIQASNGGDKEVYGGNLLMLYELWYEKMPGGTTFVTMNIYTHSL